MSVSVWNLLTIGFDPIFLTPLVCSDQLLVMSLSTISNYESTEELVSCPCGSALPATISFRSSTRQYFRCQECALVFRSPRPRDAAIEKEYQHAYDAIYLKSSVDHYRAPVFRSVLEHLSEYKTPPGHLLDIGCGAGEFALLCRNMGWTCSGVELSQQAAEVAARRGITMLPHDWLEEPGGLVNYTGRFDVITLINVLDSVCDPIGVLRRVHQMLNPGGVVVIRVPNAIFHLSVRRVLNLLKAQRQQAFHLYIYSPSTLENLLSSVGLWTLSVRNSKTGCTPGCAPVNGAEKFFRRLVWRASGLGFWLIAQSIYWLTRKQAVLAPSFELVARRVDE